LAPELAVTLVKALYGAKNQEEYPLRMEALLNTMEADRMAALAAEVSGRPLQEPQCMRHNKSCCLLEGVFRTFWRF
jgi:hypothetical protein